MTRSACAAPRSRTTTAATARPGSTCRTARRSASPIGRSSSATPRTCWSPAAASPRPTTPMPRSARWPSAWRWARRPARPRLWPSPAGVDPRDVPIDGLRDRLRADGAILELADRPGGRSPDDLRAHRPRRHRPGELGVTYAHEHLVIDGGRPVLMEPDFDLGDVDAMATEVGEATAQGLQTRRRCDAVRCRSERPEAGRAVAPHRGPRLAPTGLHHDRYYGPAHWSAPPPGRGARRPVRPRHHRRHRPRTTTADRSCERTTHRAGVIKVAGSEGGPSERDRRIFEAAALAHLATGVPILTHCEGGTGALEQLRLADRPGRRAGAHRVQPRRQGRRPRLPPRAPGSGAFGEYDQSFRWKEANGTLQLLEWAAEDGHDGQILLGMDAARRGYYRVYGGAPGLDWLLDGFTVLMADVAWTRRPAAMVRGRTGAGVRLRRRYRGGGGVTRSTPDQRGRIACPPVVVRRPASTRPSAATSARPTCPRCSTTRSISPSTTRRRPASTSCATARCGEPGSSRPSSTST